MLEQGTRAPDFTLRNQKGEEVSLSDFAGKKVVLYFYPKDNTPGCTKQACAFASVWDRFESLGIPVVGISKDSVSSHEKFAQKYQPDEADVAPAYSDVYYRLRQKRQYQLQQTAEQQSEEYLNQISPVFFHIIS